MALTINLTGVVPYTGATSDVNLGEFGIQLGNLEFDNTPTNVPTGAGSLVWNDTDGTLDLGLKGGLLNKIGQQVVVRARNNSGSAITKGSVVKVVGVAGGFIGINLALGDSDANSATAFGIVAEDIADASNGFVSIQGIVHNLNTNSFTEGDVLYLSPTVAGTFTNVKPVAPQHAVVVGYVAKKSATDGHILMHVQNGYELGELHDTLLTSSADKDILAYESSTSLWKNKSASTLGIAPLASPTFTGTVVLPSTTSIGNVSNTEIGYLDGVTSAIQTQIDSKSEFGFTLKGMWSSTNQADATTYYASSGAANVGLLTGRVNIAPIAIPKNCTLKSVSVNLIQGAASSEVVTYNIDINSVQTLIATNNSTATTITISNYAMNVTCLQGELIYLQIVCPTWVTNPTGNRGVFICYFE